MANSVNLSKGLINKIPTNAKLITLKLLKIKVTEKKKTVHIALKNRKNIV